MPYYLSFFALWEKAARIKENAFQSLLLGTLFQQDAFQSLLIGMLLVGTISLVATLAAAGLIKRDIALTA